MKRLIVLFLILIAFIFVWNGFSNYFPSSDRKLQEKAVTGMDESLVVDVVKKVTPSVVTIGVEGESLSKSNSSDSDVFDFFFGEPKEKPSAPLEDNYIGSGFVVKKDGLIVTNKHVVSDVSLKYVVVDQKGNKYNVDKIYRDPLNDLAILKIKNSPSGGFLEVELGDSNNLQVGQMAIAIGTALGEFRNTVTTGVISGLGRGITAGDPFEGLSERLDNVIQTDAAINPGNSGGPLLNSHGQVIGVNSAVSAQGQNIGFAIPISIVKDSLKNFNETGQFNRPFLGVSYRMISKQAAILNDLTEGAYVQEVIIGSPAEKSGIVEGDIIIKIDNDAVRDNEGGLAAIVAKKKIGQTIKILIDRSGKKEEVLAVLTNAPAQGK